MTSIRDEMSPVETVTPGKRVYLAGASRVIGIRLVLPGAAEDLPKARLLNARIRVEGTANLIHAMAGLDRLKIVAQSIAWPSEPGPAADAVASLEAAVLAANGVVLRYGAFYGPGTYYEGEIPSAPCVHIDAAAARTLDALDAPSGILTVVDD